LPDREEVNLHGCSICQTPDVNEVVNFAFMQPGENGKYILMFLYKKDKPMRTKDIFEVLRDQHVQGFETLFS
jgi:hypothetical protein